MVRYAPLAAKQAASVGAHIEASKLYLSAIEYYQGKDNMLYQFYEAYAYECYLINQITEAIFYQTKALGLLKEISDPETLATAFVFCRGYGGLKVTGGKLNVLQSRQST